MTIEQWRLATLAEVARWGSGGTPSAGNPRYYGGDIPWAVIGDLNDGLVSTTAKTITDEGLASSAAKWVPRGAVLVAMYGSIGKLGIAAEPLTTNQAIAFAVPGPELDAKFLFYYLMSQRRLLDAQGKGATQRNISQSILKPWPIRVPTLTEQRRIVEILEEHLSHLDAADQALESAHSRFRRLRTSALWFETHLAGARPHRLDGIAEVRLGRQRSPRNHTGERMRPYLRAANVGWDRLLLDDVKEMHFTESEERTHRLEPGDILLTEASGSPAEVGKSALYQGQLDAVCIQNTLLRVRVHSANAEFVQKFLLAEAMNGRFMPEARGVGINHLGRDRLAALSISLPSAEEQECAVRACVAILDDVAALQQTVDISHKRSDILRRAVLSAAFEGKLTGRQTDTEVIEEMAAGHAKGT